MNRSLTNVLFGGIAPIQASKKIEGEVVTTSVDETVDALANAENVIIVRPDPSAFLSLRLKLSNRSSATAWQSPKHNMPYPRLQRCCDPKESMYVLRSIQSQAECLANVMCSLRRLLFLTTVSLSPLKPAIVLNILTLMVSCA